MNRTKPIAILMILGMVAACTSCDHGGNENARLAALSPAQRQAEWPKEVKSRDGAPITSLLPAINSIAKISVVFYDDDDNRVTIDIPKSQWSQFYDFLSDCQPITFESEILVLASVVIVTTDGNSQNRLVLSHGANPVIFEWGAGFASNRSELEVLEFLESFQDEGQHQRFRGWYPRE